MGRPVDQIDLAAVLSVPGPVYRDKPATGKLLRGWVRGVLAAAQALEHVDVNAAGERSDRRGIAEDPEAPRTSAGVGVRGRSRGAGGGRGVRGESGRQGAAASDGDGCGRSRLPVEFPHVGGGAAPGRQGTSWRWPLHTWSAGLWSGVTREATCSTSGGG